MALLRRLASFAIGVALLGEYPLAQTRQDAPVPAATTGEKPWSLSGSVFTYLLPGEGNYAQPTLTADRDWLHLEARYNYESRQAGSAWSGYNFSFGENVAWTLTPMLGVVFGDTSGVAPGYKVSVSWRKLDLASESEYVFDTSESSDSFFYTWSEFGWTPKEYLRLGLVVQRTKVYQTDLDIQRGLLVGVSYRNATFTTYVFNPDGSRPTVVLGAGVSF